MSSLNKQSSLNASHLIDACGRSWFFSSLKQYLQSLFAHDYSFSVLYPRASRPIILEADFQGLNMDGIVEGYLDHGHKADPVARLASIGKLPDAIVAMNELTVSAATTCPVQMESIAGIMLSEKEEAGFLTPGWPAEQSEIVISISLDSTRQVGISLFTQSVASKQQLTAQYDIIAAVLKKHFEWIDGTPSSASQLNLTPTVPSAHHVVGFFIDVLACHITEREAQIFGHLLIGHSPKQIAATLNVSASTVTTHRRNVYRRISHVGLTELIRWFNEYALRTH